MMGVRARPAPPTALEQGDEVIIELEDRQGQLRRFPIVSVSLGIASSAQRAFTNHRELVATATELKHVAKRQQGSSYALDRRTDGFF